ncbi:MAG: hypothetical protein LBN97_01690 [Oscillospiraceae bacterium]|nr:hypothetical protein [Oscillospiraceae bacterium]
MKRVLSAILIIIFISGLGVLAAAESLTTPKSETVYAKLSADGSVTSGIYVINDFELSEKGEIRDKGDYLSIVNLSSSEAILSDSSQSEHSITAGPGLFRYQGNLDPVKHALPWKISVSYVTDLSGKAAEVRDLPGFSGDFQCTVSVSKADNLTPELSAIYNALTLQITVTLNSNKFSNVTSSDATFASSGNDRLLTFTILPGGVSSSVSYNATVRNFEIAPVTIAAIQANMSLEFDDLDITNADSQLQQLSGAGPMLLAGANGLVDNVFTQVNNEFAVSFAAMGATAPTLTRDNYRATLEAIAAQYPMMSDALNGVTAQLDGAVQYLSGLTAYTEGVEQLTTELGSLLGNFSGVTEAYTPVSFTDSRNVITQQQFVIQLDAIEIPKLVVPAPEPEVLTLWQKFLRLFGWY